MHQHADIRAACDALSALFEPTLALFAGLRQGHPHLIDDVCTQRFSIALSPQGAPVLSLATDPIMGHQPTLVDLPYADAARAAGLGGHAGTRMIGMLRHAETALHAAAPCATVAATHAGATPPPKAALLLEEHKVWHQDRHIPGVMVCYGALRTVLSHHASPSQDTAWRLALLACLSSPGRAHRYLSDQHRSFPKDKKAEVWADSAEDAALIMAARLRDPQEAEAFLAKGATFWTHPITTPPSGPMPWDFHP